MFVPAKGSQDFQEDNVTRGDEAPFCCTVQLLILSSNLVPAYLLCKIALIK